MFGLRLQEIIIIALVVLLLFGGKKIPELMKGLGKGVKSFKDGLNETSAPETPERNRKKKKRRPSDLLGPFGRTAQCHHPRPRRRYTAGCGRFLTEGAALRRVAGADAQ